MPLINPSQHSFRQLSNRPNIYIKKYSIYRYQIQSEKISSSINEFKRNHLDPGKYIEKTDFGYTKSLGKNLTPVLDRKHRYRESEIIQKRIFSNSGLSLEPLNGSKIANPNFRDEDRSKWKGVNGI